jgi:hypothetical protein
VSAAAGGGGELPVWKPHVNTSTSAGTDGVRAELYRWTRRESDAATWKYRKGMALAVTRTINKALRDGVYPGIAEAILVALYKGEGDRARR